MTDTDELRGMIEDIDQTIIENIATRMEIADKLAEAKKKEGQRYWDESKEKEVQNRYHELCEEVGLSEEEARKIADAILTISRERQKHYFE
ncbi:MAG: chorismate mutase [Candidatus Methanomethylophilaceae archaeon]|nr:chorismate mutase [Candidatus Methanomethylophilaceae archaeon]MDY5873091.1 chorismate mutase [Candidatus Methanomethylophilaceae archaeon]